ncbi:hypothetical protein C8E95_2891 [Pseudonocardia autotrophica]|uniref:Uncharacterized protein n=1 Tax=Pseudonocardia autotrophica TaxID=2074 RepID=A0A1Y2N2F2_PSEAH|nr:hypothetical protein BG845_02430 [Pseudonocardia autotrophica]TDN73785.1 hypothetical protein C8E95_2891 [Pseudonocardia autotrophica]
MRAVDTGAGGDPEPVFDPAEVSGPVIGAGTWCAGADGDPVPVGHAGPGSGYAGPRAPEGGREPLAGARGPAGGGVPPADRLATARRVLHRMEARADPERSRPRAGPCTGSARPAGVTIGAAAGAAAAPVDPLGPGDPVLPVLGPLSGLLPGGGLRRGSTVAVGAGAGAGSLLFALLAAASAEGAWAGVVGRPGLGATAAAESGVRLDRLALVPDPGADVVPVTAALLDGLDLVVVAGPERAGLRAADRQRLMARARQRGSVLLALGSWPGADLRLHCERAHWEGAGRGAGRLRSRRVEVRAHGRGIGLAGRGAEVLLPGPGGTVVEVQAEAGIPAVRVAG